MSRTFLLAAVLYEVALAMLFLAVDVEFNGQRDDELFRAGIYSMIVVCSWLLAVSALTSALSKRRRGVLRWVTWPPEWDGTVAGWATAKALFFSVLWFYGMGWRPPYYVLTAALIVFADIHVLFTAQWLGINKRTGEEVST